MKNTLTKDNFQWAANFLGCEVAAIMAVDHVESRGSGFYSNGHPTILFERHVFSKLTNRKYDKTHPDISNPSAGGYGSAGQNQINKLNKAYNLDADFNNKVYPNADNANKSCSWGRFQIMGFNHNLCGFQKVNQFVSAMHQDEFQQLIAFCNFLKTTKLDVELKKKNWAAFAKGYNGPGYKKNNYDVKLKAAYDKFSKGG